MVMIPLGFTFAMYNVLVAVNIAILALYSASGSRLASYHRAFQDALILFLAYAPSLPFCPQQLRSAVNKSRMRNSVQAVAIRTGILCGATGGVIEDIGSLWQARQPFIFLYVVSFCVEWAMYLLALTMRLTPFRVDTANCIFLVLGPPLVVAAYLLPFRLQGCRSIFVGFDLLACYTVLRGFEAVGLGLARDCREGHRCHYVKEVEGSQESTRDTGLCEPHSAVERGQRRTSTPFLPLRKGVIKTFRATYGMLISPDPDPRRKEFSFLISNEKDLGVGMPVQSTIKPVDYLMAIGLSLKLVSDQCFIFCSFYSGELQADYALRAMQCVSDGLGSLLLGYASLAALL